MSKRKIFTVIGLYTTLFMLAFSTVAFADGPLTSGRDDIMGELEVVFIIAAAGIAIWALIQRKFTVLVIDILIAGVVGMFVFFPDSTLESISTWIKSLFGW